MMSTGNLLLRHDSVIYPAIRFPRVIELKPSLALGQFAHGFHARRAYRAHCEGNIMLMGGGGQNLRALGHIIPCKPMGEIPNGAS